jgi:hypothetical protein
LELPMSESQVSANMKYAAEKMAKVTGTLYGVVAAYDGGWKGAGPGLFPEYNGDRRALS